MQFWVASSTLLTMEPTYLWVGGGGHFGRYELVAVVFRVFTCTSDKCRKISSLFFAPSFYCRIVRSSSPRIERLCCKWICELEQDWIKSSEKLSRQHQTKHESGRIRRGVTDRYNWSACIAIRSIDEISAANTHNLQARRCDALAPPPEHANPTVFTKPTAVTLDAQMWLHNALYTVRPVCELFAPQVPRSWQTSRGPVGRGFIGITRRRRYPEQQQCSENIIILWPLYRQ